jgi:hypothetical protein
MKKMFTLLAVCLAITASSFAQWGNGNGNPHDNRSYGNKGYNNDQYRIGNFRTEDDLLRDMNLSRSQERKVTRVNQQYQQAIYRVQNDRFASSQQKRFQLERLEQQRRQDIINVLSSFQRDRYNAWCARNDNSRNTYGNDRRNGQGNNGRW